MKAKCTLRQCAKVVQFCTQRRQSLVLHSVHVTTESHLPTIPVVAPHGVHWSPQQV